MMNSKGSFCSLDELGTDDIARWRELSRSGTAFASPFFQYGFACAIQAIRGGVHVWLGRDEDGVLQQILPVQRRIVVAPIVKNLGGWERLGGELCDYFAPISSGCIAPEVDGVLSKSPIDYLSYSHYPALLHDQQAGAHYTTAVRIELEAGSRAYLDWLEETNLKYVRDAQRRRRKLEREHGELVFNWHDTDPELVAAVITSKRAQYARTGARDSLASTWSREFLRRIAHNNVENDFSVVLSSLRCDGRWVALHFGLLANGVLQLWFPVYRPEFARYAPGRLLLLELIEHSSAHGVKLIDRGDGSSDEKLQTANSMHRMKKHFYRRSGVSGVVNHAVDAVRWRTERQIRFARSKCRKIFGSIDRDA